jgi:hypothetical protein
MYCDIAKTWMNANVSPPRPSPIIPCVLCSKLMVMLKLCSHQAPSITGKARFDPASWSWKLEIRARIWIFISVPVYMNYTCEKFIHVFARKNLLIISSRNSVKIGWIWYVCFQTISSSFQVRCEQFTISHFPIEQRTGSSRLFGRTKNKQYAEYGI